MKQGFMIMDWLLLLYSRGLSFEKKYSACVDSFILCGFETWLDNEKATWSD